MSSENGVNPPALNPSHNSSFSLLSVLERERLTGPNYMDWMRNLKMKGYFDMLESLNMVFDAELSINIIRSGLPADYNQFVLSYQMNGNKTSIMELHSLLQTAKQGIKKIDVPSIFSTPYVTCCSQCKIKERLLIPTGKERPQKESPIVGLREFESEIAPTGDPKEAVCFYCNTKGHWKRSCLKYLKDLKDGKSKKGLKESRKLKHGELNLVMRNMKITPVTKIGKYELMLKSGLDKFKMWHSRLGQHKQEPSPNNQQDGVLNHSTSKSDDVCESCLLGKMTKSPSTKRVKEVKDYWT
ncbi:retrotransposon protein, putative, ty1-copia subclass [Tanacetum coccineum]